MVLRSAVVMNWVEYMQYKQLRSVSSKISSSIPHFTASVKGKAIPSQAFTGPEGSRRLGLPDFKKIDT
jgi:hypothetical protein